MQDIPAQDSCLLDLALAEVLVLAEASALVEDLVSAEASEEEEDEAGGAEDSAHSGDTLILR
ncbi:hypothetical protein AMJ44_01725 [candidate division WOR-1 bacterium DG_54_3]|uniref:Uncharacterized protein n=1 Tax=candidate division WOR-1 bacterium DG_54_3 TaxID=1703775 RepID=A0A0S7Y725_UNCSA|nr:MAG: hypothetical protein AMJ44_01725 [candidate division WOR-1 bacterium DG_54_3]